MNPAHPFFSRGHAPTLVATLIFVLTLVGSDPDGGTAHAAQVQRSTSYGSGGSGGGGGAAGSGSGGNGTAGGHAGGGALTVGVSPEGMTFQMVRDPSIAADLALPPIQKRAFDEAQRRYDAASTQLQQTIHRLEQAGPLSPNFGRDMSSAISRAEREMFAAIRPALATLTPAQHARLQEIRYQHPLVLVNPSPEVIAALELTPDQLAKARQINEEARRDAFAAMHSIRGPMKTERRESRSADGSTVSASSFSSAAGHPDPAVHAEAAKRIQEAVGREDRRLRDEVLTPAQQERLKQLQGRPLKPLQPASR